MSSENKSESPASLGLYLHVPFCVSHCAYCDFYTKAYEGSPQVRRFASALAEEIPLSAKMWELEGRRVDTIYLGGGTPSLLEEGDLRVILNGVRNSFRIAERVEISLEANPENVTEATVTGYLEQGVNRISLGVQSFQEPILRGLGRSHDPRTAVDAVEICRRAGCDNLSLDLMLALPGQDEKSLEEDLSTLLSLAPEHASAYLLEMDKETILRHRIERGELPAPTQEVGAALYEQTRTTLSAAGYQHYEISSFARNHRRCRHNLKYWTDQEFLGCGPSAWSYLGGNRARVTLSLETYLESVREGKAPPRELDERSETDRLDEAVFAGLRLLEGVDLDWLARRYGSDPLARREGAISAVMEAGLVERSGTRLRLTSRGLPVANEVFQIFV